MNAHWVRRALGLAAGLALVAWPSVSLALYTQYVRVSGTSTGGGTCAITIESFGSLLYAKVDRPEAQTVYTSNSTITNGSSAASTAAILRNDVDAALPGDFTVTNPTSNIVQIVRSSGTFTVNVQANVPGQTIEVFTPVPGLSGGGLVALAAALALSGGLLAVRRRGIA